MGTATRTSLADAAEDWIYLGISVLRAGNMVVFPAYLIYEFSRVMKEKTVKYVRWQLLSFFFCTPDLMT